MKAEEILQTINETIADHLNGGKGSGNWGHSGRPGKVGGSGAGGGLGSGGAGKSSAKGPDDLKDDYSKNFRDEASVGSWKISDGSNKPATPEQEEYEYGLFRAQQQINLYEIEYIKRQGELEAHVAAAEGAKAIFDKIKRDYESGKISGGHADTMAGDALDTYKKARDQMDFVKEQMEHAKKQIKQMEETYPEAAKHIHRLM